MSQENHQNEMPPEYIALVRELEQPENRPVAPPPPDDFRRSLRRELIDRYEAPGLSRRGIRRLWQFAGAAMGILLLGAAITFFVALRVRQNVGAPAAAIVQTVDPAAGRQDGGAAQDPPLSSGLNENPVPENAGTGRVWLVSVIQKERATAGDPVTIEVEVGYELAGRDDAELQLLYAAPDWSQNGGPFVEGEMRRVLMDSLTDNVRVQQGSEVLWFTFTGRPAEMAEIVGTDRPVLVARLGYIEGEGEVVELKILAMETFLEYPLDLTDKGEHVYRPEWDALGIDACVPTEPELAIPPDDPNASPMGEGPYFINQDRTLWMSAPSSGLWHAGGTKVAYIRPPGADLQVTGRRLDADAPPLHADNPCCYTTGFQVGGLIFPTEGCWEVTVSTGEAELRVVTRVLPNLEPPAGGECVTPADAVAQSDAIILGEVLETEGDERYAWQNVAVRQTWQRPAGVSGIGDRINILQDLAAEPGLEVGKRYVLFVQESTWQIHCPQQTIYQVQGEQATSLGAAPLWPAVSFADLMAAILELQD